MALWRSGGVIHERSVSSETGRSHLTIPACYQASPREVDLLLLLEDFGPILRIHAVLEMLNHACVYRLVYALTGAHHP